ncbi:hypothetical protein [Bacillus sp. NPDC094106]|uniref:hypothetical protein n=1 Tax=Bacillus sp. NPDC094106 TaxID=3363949 RepID=UPI003800C2EF
MNKRIKKKQIKQNVCMVCGSTLVEKSSNYSSVLISVKEECPSCHNYIVETTLNGINKTISGSQFNYSFDMSISNKQALERKERKLLRFLKKNGKIKVN